LRTEIAPATSISDSPTRIPGRYPAKNSAAMDTPPDASEYTMRMLDGGITSPVVAEVMLIAAVKFLS
jgi:hypothetical protein